MTIGDYTIGNIISSPKRLHHLNSISTTPKKMNLKYEVVFSFLNIKKGILLSGHIYVCVSTIDFASVYKIFRLDLGTVLTTVFVFFTLLYRST